MIVATPTNFDAKTNYFNTSFVEAVTNDVNQINPASTIIIKSTIPVDFVTRLQQEKEYRNIIFHQNFYVKVERYMIIFILHVCSWRTF